MDKQLLLFSGSGASLFQRFINTLPGSVDAEFCGLLQDIFHIDQLCQLTEYFVFQTIIEFMLLNLC